MARHERFRPVRRSPRGFGKQHREIERESGGFRRCQRPHANARLPRSGNHKAPISAAFLGVVFFDESRDLSREASASLLTASLHLIDPLFGKRRMCS